MSAIPQRACLAWVAVGFMVVSGAIAADTEPTGPKIVSTSPAIGASAVDPATTEIRVTFDQEMAGGFSWTGGGDVYPEIASKPYWEDDKRTCVLPVKLEAGKFYRVGINSSSHRNFRGENEIPAELRVIYFATAGADQATLAKLSAPNIVSLEPSNGAADVSPSRSELVVTFDIPMGGGFSWTKAGGVFPETTGRAEWNEDRTVCRLPVALEPGQTYKLGINHPYANNFQSESGVPLAPVVWSFSTPTE